MSTPSFTKEPSSTEPPCTTTPTRPNTASSSSLKTKYEFAKRKVMTREGWLGDYDYGWLCMPTLPYLTKKNTRNPPFYELDDELPLILAISCGLQHALAMLAGVIAPPIILASSLNLPTDISAYMVSSALIGCGLLSLIQISRIHLFKNYYIGTGLITVVGTSFSVLSVADAIFNTMYADGTCPSSVMNGVTVREPCPDAYGKLLGTSLVCSFLEIFMSLCSPRALRRIFPPIVTGTVMLLIGASLVGNAGILDWGGGSNGCQNRPPSGFLSLCPNTAAPHALPWGSPEFIGLGFLSFISIVLTEAFGSPFMKNVSVIIGLLVGCIVAAATGYMDSSTIKNAPGITFLWVHRFKIGVYPPAILPMFASYVSLALEAIGDITASAEVSRQPVVGDIFDSRIQGGILSDGIGGFLSALFTVAPLSTFSQNNGVIAITRCANRSAGRWCCAFLILFGVLGKISGVFLTIPPPVLGGVTTFLFATVAVSGVRVLSFIEFSRRDRFVLTAGLSFGIGNLLKPDIFTHLFEGVAHPNSGLKGLFDSITILLSTPFLSAGIVTVLLNLFLAHESKETTEEAQTHPDAFGGENVNDVESQPEKMKSLHVA